MNYKLQVKVLFGHYKDSFGILEEKLPGTEWFNVRVAPNLRLALTEQEFEILY